MRVSLLCNHGSPVRANARDSVSSACARACGHCRHCSRGFPVRRSAAGRCVRSRLCDADLSASSGPDQSDCPPDTASVSVSTTVRATSSAASDATAVEWASYGCIVAQAQDRPRCLEHRHLGPARARGSLTSNRPVAPPCATLIPVQAVHYPVTRSQSVSPPQTLGSRSTQFRVDRARTAALHCATLSRLCWRA